MKLLESFVIDDDLTSQNNMAIEVTVTLTDGQKRWCYFTTPQALMQYGDWLDTTTIRFHYGASHMIVIAHELTKELIEKALQEIDKKGELISSTRALS